MNAVDRAYVNRKNAVSRNKNFTREQRNALLLQKQQENLAQVTGSFWFPKEWFTFLFCGLPTGKYRMSAFISGDIVGKCNASSSSAAKLLEFQN